MSTIWSGYCRGRDSYMGAPRRGAYGLRRTAGFRLMSPGDGASKLRHIRQSHGLTCVKLARAADISTKTLKRAEDGESVRTETRYQIVKGLNSQAGAEYTLRDVFPDAPADD